jgi:SNF2 family DNA or RNA helicase
MKGSQILQNLIIHRKVCNHPSLVIDQIPNDLKNTLKYENNQFINDSGKLLGLIDLLKEC